jgi:hypothetical protein
MSNYTILIICEGEKTEPLFFQSINDGLLKGNYDNDIRNGYAKIVPEPKIDIDEEANTFKTNKVKHKPRRKKRKTKRIPEIENDRTKTVNLSFLAKNFANSISNKVLLIPDLPKSIQIKDCIENSCLLKIQFDKYLVLYENNESSK